MKEYPIGAVSKRADGSYSIKPFMTLGRIPTSTLLRIAEAVDEFGLSEVRISAAQRLLIDGVPEDKVDALCERLGEVGDGFRHPVTLCPGKGSCPRGLQNTVRMGERMNMLLRQFEDLPSVIKCGLSGCPRGCGESYVRDIGLVGAGKGWTVVFGGNAGSKSRQGDVIGTGLSEDEAIDICARVLRYYGQHAKKRERTARFVERVGIEAIFSL